MTPKMEATKDEAEVVCLTAKTEQLRRLLHSIADNWSRAQLVRLFLHINDNCGG
jgi:hypothetical protein